MSARNGNSQGPKERIGDADVFDPLALTVEEFDQLEGNHAFSESYEKRKHALIAQAGVAGAAGATGNGASATDRVSGTPPIHRVQPAKRTRGRFTWRIAAAVAAACIALPVGAYAATQIIAQLNVNQEGTSLALDAQGRDGASLGTLAASQIKPAKLVLPQIEGYTLNDEGKITYDWHEGFEAGRDMTLLLVQLDTDLQAQTLVTDVGSWEELDLDGTRCIYVLRDGIAGSSYNDEDKTGFSQQAYLLFEEEGYLLQVFAQAGIPKDELVGYLGQFKLEPCTQDEASSYTKASTLLETMWAEGETVPAAAYAPTQVVKAGETVATDQGAYTIEKVTVTDDASAILASDGAGMDEERFAALRQAVDENGKLKPYLREHLTYGDGITSPSAVVDGSEQVNLKLVLVDVRVKNTASDNADRVFVGQDLSFLAADGDKLVESNAFYSFNRPDAVVNLMLDNSPQWFAETVGGKAFYFADLPQGDEQVFHLGYFVDEDFIDAAYYTIGYNDDATRLIKLK